MPLYIGVFLCFPSRARVGAYAGARESQGSRARFARLLAPRRLHFATLVPPAGALDFARDCSAGYTRALLFALAPLVIGCRPPFGRLPLLSPTGSDGAAATGARSRPRCCSSRSPCPLRCWLPCPSGSALARLVLVARQGSPVRFRVEFPPSRPVSCNLRQKVAGGLGGQPPTWVRASPFGLAPRAPPLLITLRRCLRRWGLGVGGRASGMPPCSLPLVARSRALRARARGSPLMGRALRSASGGG